MNLSREQCRALGVALNEADFVGFSFDPAQRIATATFLVLTLAEDGGPTTPREVQLLLSPVGRIAASLRRGYWDDRDAAVVPLGLDELPAVVRSFGGMPIYGWEFIDVHDEQLAKWGDRLSLDWRTARTAPGGLTHSLSLFQDPADRTLDLCVWFDDLEILDGQGRRLALDAFVAGGERWWRAFHAGDARTGGHGMVPLAPEPRTEPGCSS